jgi:hypothetical protein
MGFPESLGGTGFEPVTVSQVNEQVSPPGGAESGALTAPADPELSRIVAAWPRLPVSIRHMMLDLVKGAAT